MQIRLIKAAIIATSIAMVGGCATITQEQFDAVKAQAQSAAADASQALDTANNAMNVANEANITALDAQDKVGEALTCCYDNAARIERAFKDTMAK